MGVSFFSQGAALHAQGDGLFVTMLRRFANANYLAGGNKERCRLATGHRWLLDLLFMFVCMFC